MAFHNPEHLNRKKQAVIDAVNAIKFNQHCDYPVEGIEDLVSMSESVLNSVKDLLESVGVQIDGFDYRIKAESEFKEGIEEMTGNILDNIRSEVESRQPPYSTRKLSGFLSGMAAE